MEFMLFNRPFVLSRAVVYWLAGVGCARRSDHRRIPAPASVRSAHVLIGDAQTGQPTFSAGKRDDRVEPGEAAGWPVDDTALRSPYYSPDYRDEVLTDVPSGGDLKDTGEPEYVTRWMETSGERW
ncbi:hypothetical protein [Nocardia sp. NPDC002869]|uniref:hypothetical protein n=1 Tax=Nocardia sp. NPDC002869 TaxID=3161032 RepID=UPI00398D678B